ncbi:MAG: AAA family ATPase [Oscillospiraceae bacterium]|jgi:ATP-dependent Clp protease ATP-binding subunit ClpA|nr:AAA family ATPase [Oscillospiraceae bacterium]
MKKITAILLATLFLIGNNPTGMKNLNFASKVNADFFNEDGGLNYLEISKFFEKHLTVIVLGSIPVVYKLGKWLYIPFVNDIIMPLIKLMKSFKDTFKYTFIYNRRKLENNPVKFREVAKKFLKDNIFAQDKAIEKIVSILSGHIDMQKENNSIKNPVSSACTMVMIGDSGVGKTLTARLLSQLLFGQDMQPWQFITVATIETLPPKPFNTPNSKKQDDPSSKTEAFSPADRLFNESSKLIYQLQKNNRIIVVIDEIDKIHRNDPKDTILERLRDAKDTGKLKVYFSNGGRMDIDVSKTVFICISNEFRECWGLPKKNLTPKEAAARTIVERDKSLVNRFNVVEFENFKKNDYMVILAPLVAQIQKYYSYAYNMDIEFSEDFPEVVGRTAEERNKGVRGVNDFLVELRGKLVKFRLKNKILAKEKLVRKVIVKYDRKKDKFSVETKN